MKIWGFHLQYEGEKTDFKNFRGLKELLFLFFFSIFHFSWVSSKKILLNAIFGTLIITETKEEPARLFCAVDFSSLDLVSKVAS